MSESGEFGNREEISNLLLCVNHTERSALPKWSGVVI